MGLYKRKEIWWMDFSINGKQYRYSTERKDKKSAQKILDKIKGEIAEGKHPSLYMEKVTFNDLCTYLINDYKKNKRRSLDRAQLSIKHLTSIFDGMRAVDITSERIDDYILSRQDMGASNGTINRELCALHKMFNLAKGQTPPKVLYPPTIKKLKEGSPRQGFFEYGDYIRLLETLPDYLKPVLTMAYLTGMRKSEILNLEWSHINLSEKKITLPPELTKNGEGRNFYFEGYLYELILRQLKIRENKYPNCRYVIFREGHQIKNYQAAWHTACKKAGLDGKFLHDNRRTAIRNMSRAGIPDAVAMNISGHKTRSVFDRYNIVSEDDRRNAAKKIDEAYRERKETFERENKSITFLSQSSSQKNQYGKEDDNKCQAFDIIIDNAPELNPLDRVLAYIPDLKSGRPTSDLCTSVARL